MNRFFVKILRKSVRKNPHAGEQTFYESGPVQVTVRVVGPHESLESNPKFKMVQQSTSIGSRGVITESTTYVAMSLTVKETRELFDTLKGKVTIDVQHSPVMLNVLTPEPEWLYEYKRTKVKCSYCRKSFYHDELIDEYDEMSDSYVYDACPKCEAGSCCKVDYEKIEDVLLSKLGLPRMVVKG